MKRTLKLGVNIDHVATLRQARRGKFPSPEYAAKVCREVQAAPDTTFGILVCGTGIGMSMCANKFRGVRAAVCSDTYSARLTRNHNNANVLCLGARVIGECLAEDVLDSFLSADFEGGRHQTRLDMMKAIEEENR